MRKVEIKNKSTIIIEDYPFHEKLRDELVPQLENHPDRQGKQTNVKATMTNWNWQYNNPRVKRLKESAMKIVNDLVFMNSNSEFRETWELKWIDFWGNVYRQGEYTQTHEHVPSTFSFVYFLKSQWNDSPLVFSDFGHTIRPKQGRYVIFPSHLKHHVPPQKSKNIRMTLSGNMTCTFNRKIYNTLWGL